MELRRGYRQTGRKGPVIFGLVMVHSGGVHACAVWTRPRPLTYAEGLSLLKAEIGYQTRVPASLSLPQGQVLVYRHQVSLLSALRDGD